MSSSSAEASEPPIHLNQLCFKGKGRAGKHLKQAGQATPRTKIGKSNAPDIGKKLNNFLNTKSRFRNQIINSGIVRWRVMKLKKFITFFLQPLEFKPFQPNTHIHPSDTEKKTLGIYPFTVPVTRAQHHNDPHIYILKKGLHRCPANAYNYSYRQANRYLHTKRHTQHSNAMLPSHKCLILS